MGSFRPLADLKSRVSHKVVLIASWSVETGSFRPT